MRWGTSLVGTGLALLMTACGASGPSERSAEPSVPPSPSGPPPSASIAPSPSVAGELPEPGQPFDAAAILAAMRDSRRPGGVPDEIETESVAGAVAAAIWTIDGEPWESGAAGGSCGPDACTLELAGSGTRMAGEDVWVFSVSPGDGTVDLLSADLHAVPTDLAASLDDTVRASDPERLLEDLVATSVRWLPPPDEGRFVVAYRSGEEEGSCSREATIDARDGSVEISAGAGC